MKTRILKYFLPALVLMSLFLPSGVLAAGTATLYLSPGCGPVYNGQNLTVDIHEDSGSTATNAVQADLNYSSVQLTVVSVTVASGWAQAQNDTSTPGTILFAAYPSPTGSTATGDNKVATIVFQAQAPSGLASISFANSSNVIDASDNSAMALTTTGGAYPQGVAHSCGSLIKSSNSPTVYMIYGGAKHPFSSRDTFLSYGYRWGWIANTITPAEQSLPTGSTVPFREGALVQGSSPTVYVIDNSGGTSVKRGITSLAIFKALGYTSKDILRVPDSELPANGLSISSAATHPAGTLVKSSSSPTIYLIGQSFKQPFPNPYTFITNGYSSTQVKTATSADLTLPNGTIMTIRPGALVKGTSATIYVIDEVSGVAQKRGITSLSVFNELGYNFTQVTSIPNTFLPSVNGLAL